MPRVSRAWTDDDIRDKTVPGRAYSTFNQPGLMLRCGARKRSWQVRFEGKQGYVQRQLGEWPRMGVDDAAAIAKEMWERYTAGKPVDAPAVGEDTIATTWPKFKEWLINKGRSASTIAAYTHSFDRLSDEIKQRSLRELSADPRRMEAECERIRKRLANRKRRGQNAAAQAAVFVSTLFSYAQRRDPTLTGNPTSACQTVVPKRSDLSVLKPAEMPGWYEQVRKLQNPIVQEALLFCLFSGLRRESLVNLQWSDLDISRRCLRVRVAKGGEEKAFDLVLTVPMLRSLKRVRDAARVLFPEQGKVWIFPGEKGHLTGNSLTKYGVVANHGLRRTFASVARNVVGEDIVGGFLNHSGKTVTGHYIYNDHLGRMIAAAQREISAKIVKALDNPPGLA